MGRTKRRAVRSSDADQFLVSQMYQCQQYLASRSIAPGFNLDPETFELAAWPFVQRRDKSGKSSGACPATLGTLDFSSPTPPKKRPRLESEPRISASLNEAEPNKTGPTPNCAQSEPPPAQFGPKYGPSNQPLEPRSSPELRPALHSNPSLEPPPQPPPPPTSKQHMHQLLQLLERQQRHMRAKDAVPSPAAPTFERIAVPRAETGGSHAGQSDPRLLDLQRALLYASAARSQQTEAAEPSKLVNAIQALLRVKQAGSSLAPPGGESGVASIGGIAATSVGVPSLVSAGGPGTVPPGLEADMARDSEGSRNSAQLHQLQRVLPQLTPATLSSLVGRLEAQKGAAFRDQQPR